MENCLYKNYKSVFKRKLCQVLDCQILTCCLTQGLKKWYKFKNYRIANSFNKLCQQKHYAIAIKKKTLVKEREASLNTFAKLLHNLEHFSFR